MLLCVFIPPFDRRRGMNGKQKCQQNLNKEANGNKGKSTKGYNHGKDHGGDKEKEH